MPDLLGSLLATTPPPSADFWYRPVGSVSSTGLQVDEEAAQRLSAFSAALRLLSNDVAKLPLEVLRLLAEGGKERARGMPLYDVLHTAPNDWQTSFEWRRQGMRHLILRGNWYNRIEAGPRGAVDRLIPLNPDRMKPVQLESGAITYKYRVPGSNAVEMYAQDEIFHVRGVSDDGIEGKSLLTWARDSVAIGLATESYAGKIFAQGSLPSGYLSVPGVLNKEASERMSNSFATGAREWHKPKVLEQGATYTETQISPEDFQMLTSRQFTVTEMARWFGLPPHKIADLSRSTNNNIEEQGLDYFRDGLSPWLVLIESAMERDLVFSDRYVVEFNAEGLLRGDTAARSAFYKSQFEIAAITPNEVRMLENRNPYDGGDTYYVPVNYRPTDIPYDEATAKAVPPSAPPAAPAARPAKSDPPGQAAAIVREAAARVLSKETLAIRKAAGKHASDGGAFRAAVERFYAAHPPYVVQTLQLAPAVAGAHCREHLAAVLTNWVEAVEAWQSSEAVDDLAALALLEE